MITIRHIFVSPGHNFYGHHGQEPGTHPMVEVDEVECVAGRGLRGDRFFDYQEDYKGQVTFFAWETLEGLRREFGAEHVSNSASRRNVITEGVDLNKLVGQEFAVQGVRFLGTEESRPCEWMDVAFRPGAREWLQGKGGLRARILSNGRIKRDMSAA